MDYPTLLNNKSAKVLAYSKETIVAEKFEAIVKLTTFNSRMKDFFDIVFLANEFDFDGSILQSAISNTFKQRKTDLNSALEMLDSDFGDQPNFKTSWEAFNGFEPLLNRRLEMGEAPINSALIINSRSSRK